MELNLNKKDFKIDWFSGKGAGGQHRNKHPNCCRITHLESGLTVNGTNHKSRIANQKEAFIKLAKKVINWYYNKEEKEKLDLSKIIRNYNQPRNEVHDKRTDKKISYKKILINGDISSILEN